MCVCLEGVGGRAACPCQVAYCHFLGQTILYSDTIFSFFDVKLPLVYEIMVVVGNTRS